MNLGMESYAGGICLDREASTPRDPNFAEWRRWQQELGLLAAPSRRNAEGIYETRQLAAR